MQHSRSTSRQDALLAGLKHDHVFDEGNPLAERNTRWAVGLTAIMMVAEITGGWVFNSMALLADGWHMSSHVVALGLSVLAYACSRRYAHDPRFAFGTWKIEVLAGYTSALLLIVVAVGMLWQSCLRLLSPGVIHYDEALPVAVLGLLVNLACAWLLRDGHHHSHGHAHEHEHAHDHGHHHDLNLRSAYLHVLADAATSVLAILALLGGKWWGIAWLDPVMGLLGAMLVFAWAQGLLRESGRVLLDAEMDAPVVGEIRSVVQDSAVRTDISDLHVWRVGKGRYACVLAVVTEKPVAPAFFRQQLAVHDELVHVTVEVNPATLVEET